MHQFLVHRRDVSTVVARRIDYCFYCYKQMTAYEMRISDWSSDVCSSDLASQVERFELVPIPKNDVERFRIMLKNEKEVALYTKMVELAGRDPEYDKRFQQYIREGSTLELREQIGRASCRERVCQYV